MAVYDDVERCKCSHCGLKRDVRSMSVLAGLWICKACYDLGRKHAQKMEGR